MKPAVKAFVKYITICALYALVMSVYQLFSPQPMGLRGVLFAALLFSVPFGLIYLLRQIRRSAGRAGR
ncbi:MAG TPA: hypothetical protein VGC74_05805 [Stenotrophomonas sp.]|jgi:hypothetical protein